MSQQSQQPQKKLKHFSYEQIRRKVSARRAVLPDYESLLLECAVGRDSRGLWFDVTCPQWQRLVSLVKQAQQQHERTLIGLPSAPPPRMSAVRDPRVVDAAVAPKLEELLKADVPDVQAIRSLCRYGIPRQLRRRVWPLLLGIHSNSSGAALVAPQTTLSALPNDRVLQADVRRTRPREQLFRREDVRRDLWRVLTQYCADSGIGYKQGMNYLVAPLFQVGLWRRADGRDCEEDTECSEEETQEGLDRIYRCYSAMLSAIMPSVFADDDFGALQAQFAVFRVLLAYHDPRLADVLDSHRLTPELYASSWFVTLLTNRLSPLVLQRFLDLVLLDASTDFCFFFFLALLLSKRRRVIQRRHSAELPELLCDFTAIQSERQIIRLREYAERLRAMTPRSARKQVCRVTSQRVDVLGQEFWQLRNAPVLRVSVDLDDPVSDGSNSGDHCGHIDLDTVTGDSEIKDPLQPSDCDDSDDDVEHEFSLLPPSTLYLDIRSKEEFDKSHLPNSLHLPMLPVLAETDAALEGEPGELEVFATDEKTLAAPAHAELREALDSLAALQTPNSHMQLCLITTVDPLCESQQHVDQEGELNELRRCVRLLLHSGCRFVCLAQGGFLSVLRARFEASGSDEKNFEKHAEFAQKILRARAKRRGSEPTADSGAESGNRRLLRSARARLSSFLARSPASPPSSVSTSGSNVPPNVSVLAPCVELSMLMTVWLSGEKAAAAKASQRLLQRLVASALQNMPTRQVRHSASEKGGVGFAARCVDGPLYGVALDDGHEQQLRSALSVFAPATPTAVGMIRVHANDASDASKVTLEPLVPESLSGRLCVLLVPHLREAALAERCVSLLLQRGAALCDADGHDHMVLVSLAARYEALQQLYQRFGALRICVSAITRSASHSGATTNGSTSSTGDSSTSQTD